MLRTAHLMSVAVLSTACATGLRISGVPQAVLQATPAVQLSLALGANEIEVWEGVPVLIDIQNSGTTAVRIGSLCFSVAGSAKHVVRVTSPDGAVRTVTSAQFTEGLSTAGSPQEPVGGIAPGSRLDIRFLLAVQWDNPSLPPLFAKAGRYTIAIEIDGVVSNEVPLVVVARDPTEKVTGLLEHMRARRTIAALYAPEIVYMVRRPEIMDDLNRVVAEYSSSVYADYARVALAMHAVHRGLVRLRSTDASERSLVADSIVDATELLSHLRQSPGPRCGLPAVEGMLKSLKKQSGGAVEEQK